MATETNSASDSFEGTECANKSELAYSPYSAPLLYIPPEKTKVKPQISAPSYLFSLKNHDAPPFKKPGKEEKPHLIIGSIMNEDEAAAMIVASDEDPVNGFTKFIGKFLVEKKVVGYKQTERNFLISLVKETVDYAAQRDYNAQKLSCQLTLYLNTHMYFKWYYWSSPTAVWSYFKEMMIRHTIEDSPDGQEVFEPNECYDMLTHFHTAYMNNLPLVHILTFGVYRLKFPWPFKAK